MVAPWVGLLLELTLVPSRAEIPLHSVNQY
jgi:hypothetical protein